MIFGHLQSEFATDFNLKKKNNVFPIMNNYLPAMLRPKETNKRITEPTHRQYRSFRV